MVDYGQRYPAVAWLRADIAGAGAAIAGGGALLLLAEAESIEVSKVRSRSQRCFSKLHSCTHDICT